ncbi:hypothetical protein ACSBR2_037835 [Camellia fascicularis]
MICEVKKGGEMVGGASPSCIFCQIASSTTLLHSDEKVVAFQDIIPSALRFGFHQPPLNSVNHLHLHCFALPYTPRWKHIKYMSLGFLGGFIEAEKLLERIKPFSSIPSKV